MIRNRLRLETLTGEFVGHSHYDSKSGDVPRYLLWFDADRCFEVQRNIRHRGAIVFREVEQKPDFGTDYSPHYISSLD